MDWNLVVSLLAGLATAIPLVIKLVEYVRIAIKEKNWSSLLNLIMILMKEAETKFETGAERKEWVLAEVKVAAKTINYDVDINAVSELIDSLCNLTKAVNVKESTVVAGGTT